MKELNKVLIIDDNEANLFSLRKILETLKLDIKTAFSGKEGLLLLDKDKFNIILLDVQMPVMDGFETLSRIRQTILNKQTPVILISAIFTEDQYKLKGMQTGAVDFIPKPMNPDILRAKVQVFLELEEHKQSLEILINKLKKSNRLLKKEIKKRERAEDILLKAKLNAEKISKNKSKLLINMSHEIRTPVNSILGFVDLISSPTISDKDKERYVRYVSNSSQNLLFLINEILDHSRIESGEFKINIGECDLDAMLEELRESFTQIKNQTGKSELSITFDKRKSSERLIIETDPQRLKQVLVNLISNAVKYTSQGGINFGYEKVNGFLRFYVKDTGIGIEKVEVKKVFTRYKRVETQESLQSQGTGLGLSIAQWIVSLFGGKIGVNSEQGHGSEFYFTIPYKVANVKIQSVKTPATPITKDPDWSDFTLLIAEDEEMNYMFLHEVLRPTLIKIKWAKNGKEAVENALSKNPPDLVLMDVKMPDMDGFEAIKQIKKKSKNLPIIIQTAFAISDAELSHKLKLSDDYITKPINRNTLIRTMGKFLI